jgi:cobalamin biosynthesis Mg chelatase CobN
MNLNQINSKAAKEATEDYEKRKQRQKEEFDAAMASGVMLVITVATAVIFVGSVYHGGIGWLLGGL